MGPVAVAQLRAARAACARAAGDGSPVNTHAPASLYEAFEPPEARRIAERLETHYTPKHGSWLNMAEIEISAMVGQCLNRRPSAKPYVAKWMLGRSEEIAKPCEWTGDARPPTRGSN